MKLRFTSIASIPTRPRTLHSHADARSTSSGSHGTTSGSHGGSTVSHCTAIASAASQPDAAERLDRAKDILREHGNYEWLSSEGSFVVLNNGIEFGVTYFVMLLALFFIGAGRYLSVDYWLRRRFGEAEGV